ncbi:DUF2786 domain-containing protein [Streptomyces sp. NPDC008150]|uniref:DUF2786 domain-containing protein n=1 Tax=Streptomyces sp. NPDC008150 TaxID=3364816 RepID=UPI0036EB476A
MALDRTWHDRRVSTTSSTVTRAFETALYASAPRTRSGRGGGSVDDALDAAASLLAADPAADTELALRGAEFVAGAWRRGWQPADVVRLVRRDLDDTHVRILAGLIRAQVPQDRPRGRRWTDQLADLPAGDPPRTDRFSYATTVLELYRLLLALPTLEPLDDPIRRNGRGVDGAGGGHRTGTESRMLTRIRALLAKAEGTEYPEEAEALSAKAQELMARHTIDEALLAAGTPTGDGPVAWRIGVEPPYEQAKAILLDAVATANHCQAVWNEPFMFSTVVGFETDLESVEVLYTSLLVQATSAMTRAEAAVRAPRPGAEARARGAAGGGGTGGGGTGGGRRRTKTFRQSFLAAYAHRIGTRLAAAAETQVTDDLLPVLATREVAVKDRVEHLFPRTTTTRLRGVSDEAGWTEGSRAADRARVGGGRPSLP